MESLCNTVYNGSAFNGFLECGSRFTLRLNTAKSTLKIALDKSSLKLNFLQKNSGRISLCPQVVDSMGSKDLHSHSSALYLKNSKCFRPLAPFLQESEICVHRISCKKFNNFNRLFFELFFDIIGTFGNIQPQCEPTFSYQYMFGDPWLHSCGR